MLLPLLSGRELSSQIWSSKWPLAPVYGKPKDELSWLRVGDPELGSWLFPPDLVDCFQDGGLSVSSVISHSGLSHRPGLAQAPFVNVL